MKQDDMVSAAYAQGRRNQRESDEALLRKALEALEYGPDVDPIFAGETEDALRAALAQQDEPVATLIAQRDALLEALRLMMDCAGVISTAPDIILEIALTDGDEETRLQANAFLVARAAIKAVEGGK